MNYKQTISIVHWYLFSIGHKVDVAQILAHVHMQFSWSLRGILADSRLGLDKFFLFFTFLTSVAYHSHIIN